MTNARRAALYKRIEVTEERLNEHLNESGYYAGGHNFTDEEVARLKDNLNALNRDLLTVLNDYVYDDMLNEAITWKLEKWKEKDGQGGK